MADARRELAVGLGLAVRDLAQRLPDAQLELRPRRRERQVELAPVAGEVLAQLLAQLAERGGVALPGARDGDRPAAGLHVEAAERLSVATASSSPMGESKVS